MRVCLGVAALALTLSGCSEHWDPAEVSEPVGQLDDRTFSAYVGTCIAADLEVDESDDEVRLRARSREGGDDESCGGETVRFELDGPLGDRPLIDDRTDRPLEVVDCVAAAPADVAADPFRVCGPESVG